MLRSFQRAVVCGLFILSVSGAAFYCVPENNSRSAQTCENFNLIPGDYDFAGLSSNDKILAIWLFARCVEERENKWCTPIGDEPAVAYRCKRARQPGASIL